MKRQTVILMLSVCFALGGASWVGAQDGDDKPEPLSDGISTKAWNPIPPGYVPLAYFTGVRENGVNMSTLVFCTNVGGSDANVIVEFSTSAAVSEQLAGVVLSQNTRTFGTNTTAAFTESYRIAVPFGIAQGSARVLVNPKAVKKSVFCSGVVVDSVNTPPIFAYPLGMKAAGK
jgi:hypothetical protein